MASFDVKSPCLPTNIPVVETSYLILDTLFSTPDSEYTGFNRQELSKMLNNCTKNKVFSFNNDAYIQLDGCISRMYANIFLCNHETKWLEECPPAFKPVFVEGMWTTHSFYFLINIISSCFMMT